MPWKPQFPLVQPTSFDEEIKRNELHISGEDLEFRKEEAARSRLANPLTVAIIGAILVGIVNIYVTHLNTTSAESIAESARYANTRQEIMKAENTNILEVIKLKNPDDVHTGLCLLIKLNGIKTADTNLAVRSFLDKQKSCDQSNAADGSKQADAAKVTGGDWITANATIPGCGISGCNSATPVCGDVPQGTKPTNNVRNFIDSFSGAWGDWIGAPTFGSDKVCRVFNQHSHNVTRAVSFQFEVVPK